MREVGLYLTEQGCYRTIGVRSGIWELTECHQVMKHGTYFVKKSLTQSGDKGNLQ